MKLEDIYLELIGEVEKHLKYIEDDDIDFLFEKSDKRFKFIFKKEHDENQDKIISSKESRLNKINYKVMNCKRCSLNKMRNNTVFGEGNVNARIMFIGEGPGENEDLTGRPFVGKAGQLLERIINNVMHLKREDVYMANIVKCRPPGNRNPHNMEVSSCIGYLYEQIKIINPELIVILGNVALSSLLPAYKGIVRNRGRELKLILSKEHIYKVIPTYHPSYLLRGRPEEIRKKKKEVWDDILKVMDILNM